jgi:hypothetical protein
MSKDADNDILSKLMGKAKTKRGEISEDAFVITGIWHVEYVINLARNIDAPVFNLGYVVIQTDEQGCSYYEKTLLLRQVTAKQKQARRDFRRRLAAKQLIHFACFFGQLRCSFGFGKMLLRHVQNGNTQILFVSLSSYEYPVPPDYCQMGVFQMS